MENLPTVSEMVLSVDDVKKYIAPNASDKELFLFMGIAKSYGLNPLKREIHFVKYGAAPASIIVGYEIYLKRAERTGKLDGWKCWIEKDAIGEKAIIEIKRKDQSLPIRWEVYRKEFDKQQSVWKSMPMFMLKKVAIAQGFRLAFPDDIGGMPYIPEEINVGTSETLPQSDNSEVISEPPLKEPQQQPAQAATEKPPLTDPSVEFLTTTQNIISVETVPFTLKSGPRKGQQSAQYIITDGAKIRYRTFSKPVAEKAIKARDAGVRAELGYEKGQYGNELKAITLIEMPGEPTTFEAPACPQDNSLPATLAGCAMCLDSNDCKVAKQLRGE